MAHSTHRSLLLTIRPSGTSETRPSSGPGNTTALSDCYTGNPRGWGRLGLSQGSSEGQGRIPGCKDDSWAGPQGRATAWREGPKVGRGRRSSCLADGEQVGRGREGPEQRPLITTRDTGREAW